MMAGMRTSAAAFKEARLANSSDAMKKTAAPATKASEPAERSRFDDASVATVVQATAASAIATAGERRFSKGKARIRATAAATSTATSAIQPARSRSSFGSRNRSFPAGDMNTGAETTSAATIQPGALSSQPDSLST